MLRCSQLTPVGRFMDINRYKKKISRWIGAKNEKKSAMTKFSVNFQKNIINLYCSKKTSLMSHSSSPKKNQRGKSQVKNCTFSTFPIGSSLLRMSAESRHTRSWYEHRSLHSAICITDIHSFLFSAASVGLLSTRQSREKTEEKANQSQPAKSIFQPQNKIKKKKEEEGKLGEEIFSLVARLNWIESDSNSVQRVFHWLTESWVILCMEIKPKPKIPIIYVCCARQRMLIEWFLNFSIWNSPKRRHITDDSCEDNEVNRAEIAW